MKSHCQVHPLTLCFRSKALEQAFMETALSQSLYQGRFAIIVGSFVFLLTAILDHWFVPPEHAVEVWTTRLTALCMPVFVYLVSFTPWFSRLRHLLLAAVGATAGIGVICMQSFLPVENAAHFYPAVALATFFTYNFVGTRFIYALAVDLLLVCAYNVVFGYLIEYPLPVLASHDFLIISANLVGGSAGYLAERQRRMLFLRERELEEANLAKSKFLAAASHDLRQPLHAIHLLIGALRHEQNPAAATAVVEDLGASAQSLEELLNELLDISKLEAGMFEPQPGVFALQEVFQGLERELRPIANEKGIELGFVATRVKVRSDPQMLARILRNIITNAVRYTDRGAVLVGCRRRGDHVAIAVHDTGPGIAPEHHEAIFREFYQLGNPERDRRKGLGLGLAIVDRLSQLLDHSVTLRSDMGRGTTFFVEVPIASADDPATNSLGRASFGDLTGWAVLVIDDEPAVRRAMIEVLARWDCRALAAESAAEALALMADEFVPDAIIADYRLRDGRTGAEAIADITRALGRQIPAMIVTGDTAPERLREAGASGYLLLHKPVQPALLRTALCTLREGAGPTPVHPQEEMKNCGTS
jgi:signal transduction histidine kinase/CheY-like chemotaxis protein